MKRNVTSLKAIINNIAKDNKISAQSVLQTLEQILAFKKKGSAPKDIPYMEKIEQYLKNRKTNTL